MRDFLSQYLYQKQWSIYPFIPPLFSLLLGLVLIPIYQKLIDKRIDELLQSNGIRNDDTGNRLDLVKAAIKTRGLQLAYLTQVPNFAIAIISAAKGNHPNLVIAALILGACVTFWSLRLFLRKPDYFATTYFPKRRKPEWLAKRRLKQIDLYAYALPILTVVVIGIIVLTLPEKKTLPGAPARVWTPAQAPVRPFSEAPTAENFIAPGLEGLYAELRKDTQRDVPELQLAPYTPYKSPDTPPNPAAYNIRQIVVKFVEGSAVRLRNGELQQVQETDALQTRGRLPRAGLEPADVQRDLIAINAAIKTMRASIGRAAPLVEEQDLANLRRRAERNVRREMPDLDLFYFAHLPEVDSETAQKFLDQLRLLRVVEVAYFQPIPFDTADIPPPTTIDVTPSQGYFRAAPAGIDVDFARNFSAGRGQGVRIADIEAGWHLGHEDLPRASFGFGVNWISGHGTAVLGQIAAEENGFGANGIVPLSIIGTSSVTNLDSFQGVYFYSVASALLMVGKVIRAGDIALIEQQFQHFGTRLVCDMATDPCKNCSIPPWVAEVMPEAEVTRTLSITVPTQPGTYNLSIVLRNGLGQALASSPVQQIVVAPNTLFDDARIAIITAPATLLSGQNNQVVIEVTNTGSTTWSTTAYSIGLQRGLRISLPQQSVALRSPVAPGGVQRLTFVISCNGPGQGWFEARMRGGTTGSFGSPAARTVICRGPVP